MGRKADASFFDKKQEWSRYKDLVLSYYLKPYLQIVKNRRLPILLVDMFAGPGRFDDGTEGSPLIMLQAASSLAQSGHPVSVLLAEKEPSLAQRLRENVRPFGSLADVRERDCFDLIDEVASRARDSTVLLYVDPFNMSRLHLGRLSQIYQRISSGSSVELLFVFMANAFMRCACACVQAEEKSADVLGDSLCVDEAGQLSRILAEALWSEDEVRWAGYAISSKSELDAIAGGNYWRKYVASGEIEYRQRLFAFVDGYCDQLKSWFPVVCKGPLFGRDNARIPKYWIVFGTRYQPAIDLINRAFATSRKQQFKECQGATLFAEVELPPRLTETDLENIVVKACGSAGRTTWQRLRWLITDSHFGEFTDSQINACIKRLLQTNRLRGADARKIDERAVLFLA